MRAVPALTWACAALAGGILLHADRMPAWATAAALALLGWRVATAAPREGARGPGRAVRALLTLAVLAAVLGRFHTVNGLAAGTTLLTLMAALKLLETRSARDARILVGAAFFLLLAACLDRQSLVRVPLYAAECWLCCAALGAIATPQLPAAAALRLAGRTLLLGVPVAVLLFLSFPRLAGSFWAIPRGEQALTGLSDTLTPAGMIELVSSYDPAFRVRFEGAPPPPAQRYWRGPVLHEFDGRTWRRARVTPPDPPAPRFLGTPWRYHVTLEPSPQRWWFALDLPAAAPDARVRLTGERELLGHDAVTEPIGYDAVSYTDARSDAPLEPLARHTDTSLPEGPNPRTRALGQALRARAVSDAAFVTAVLDYLRSGGFTYSREPGALGGDLVDGLLFGTREGFCGHYASAFVTLMRAGGVPARIVTGYLGGEWNPAGGYLVVRQADAHAWAEAWLEDRGWTRIDPTAVVAPGRLERDLDELLPESSPASRRLLHRAAWMGALLQRWDAANAWWTDHVLRFDYAAQLKLLGQLGVHSPDARQLGVAFVLVLCAWLLLLAWRAGTAARPAPPDALARAYARLCRKLARIAPARTPAQGPLDLAASVRRARPDLAPRVQMLLERYAQLRYGAPQAGRDAASVAFARAVARLSLPRRAP